MVIRFDNTPMQDDHAATRPTHQPFDAKTRSFIYSFQSCALQGMLDFNYSCKCTRCLFCHQGLTLLLVSGIGHKIRSVNDPDLPMELVKEYVRKNFPSHLFLGYVLAVEKVTTTKKDTICVTPCLHSL